jgi:F-type H+-transporting ATPase subunit delta
VSAVGRRYAKALLDLASQQKQEDAMGKELDALASAWETSRELRDVFQSPNVDAPARTKVIDALAARMGLSVTTKNAVKLLADRNRFRFIRGIARAYHTLREERGGVVLAEVISATALPDAYFLELERALGLVTGRKVRIQKSVDPSLIAGVVTKVGDKVFDGSVKNRLAELRATMLEVS